MPGTRTAGVPGTDAPDFLRVSLSFVDAASDQVTNSVIAPAGTTDGAIETYAAETQERSNGSLYQIEVSSVWQGARNSGNALEEVFANVQDNIRYSVKASPTDRQQIYIPAVLASQIEDGTENPDLTALADWFAAVLAVVGATYSGLNVGFVEHKDRNQSIKF